MRDILQDLLQRSFGVLSRYANAMAQFDEQLENLLENHRKVIKDLNCEKVAIEALLAIEDRRPAYDIKNAAEAPTPATPRTLSQILREYPWEKLSQN